MVGASVTVNGIDAMAPGGSRRAVRRSLLAFGLLLWTPACKSLPDLGPYTEATANVGQGVREAGAAVDAEIGRLATPLTIPLDADETKAEAERTAAYDKARKDLRAQWDQVVAAVDAVTAYSASLEAIYSAGKSGAKSVEKVADAAKSLADKLFGGSAPILTGAASSAVSAIYGEIAKARAAKKLQASMATMGLAVNQMATELDKALATLEALLQPQPLEVALRSRVLERYQLEYKLDLGQRKKVLEAREQAHGRFVQKLSATAPSAPDALAAHEAQLEALEDQVERLDMVLASTEPAYRAYTQEIETIRVRFDQQRRAVAETRKAVAEWARVHAALAEQLETKRPPDIAVLVQLGKQIDAAVESYR